MDEWPEVVAMFDFVEFPFTTKTPIRFQSFFHRKCGVDRALPEGS